MRFSIGLGLTTIAGTEHVDPAQAAPRRGRARRHQRQGDADRHDDADRATSSAGTASSSATRRRPRTRRSSSRSRTARPARACSRSGCRTTLDLRLEDSLGEKFATVMFVDPARARADLARHHRDQRDQHRPQLLHAGHRATARARPPARGRRDPDRRPDGRPRRGRADRHRRRRARASASAIGIAPRRRLRLARTTCRDSRTSPTPGSTSSGGSGRGGLGCSRPGSAVLGGYLPARRASKMEPAQALTQN